MRPCSMTTTSWQYRAASPRSWVISITAIRRSAVMRAIKSMMVFCVVTSRPVVGSSAMSRAGSQAIAMAIMTRWHIPPDSSCGYASSRFPASRISTVSSSPSARMRASVALRGRCARSASAICSPTVRIGLSAPRGFWKIMETAAPRMALIVLGEAVPMSVPPNRTRPRVMRPAASRRRVIAKAVTDLPDPDSPTIPSVRPA